MERFPVLIVGGGPVGLSTAILLARHGIRCLLVERKATTTNHPKARAINVRTMELLRQWGIEQDLCQHALPQAFWRFIWCTTLAGNEIARIENPHGELTDKSPTDRRIVAQDAVEAVLYQYAQTLPLVTLRFSTELQGFRETDTGVVAELVRRKSPQKQPDRSPPQASATNDLRRETIEACYLIAADGATSTVRSTLGIAMEGPAALSHQASIYFRADLTPWMAHRPADIYYCTDGIWLAVVNGTTRWLGILRYDPETGLRRDDFTPALCTEQIRRSIGVPDLPIEVINISFWTMGAQVAAHFRQGRIFLVGDAAHRMPPTGGFGLNTGIQDAHNLAWKLAAVLDGRAGPPLLDTYEAERKPVGASNAAWSAENARRIWDIIAAVHAGDQESVRTWASQQKNHICSEGRALGFQYTSEAVVPDGTPAPIFSTQTYYPSARPGSRAPHCWLVQGGSPRSTLDLFEHHFVLLTGTPGDPWRVAAQALEDAMRSYLTVFTIGPEGDLQDPARIWMEHYGLYADGAVLVRPDGHVAWRSRQGMADPSAMLATVMRRVLSPTVFAQ